MKRTTQEIFIKYQRDKFIQHGSVQHLGGNGRPPVPGQTIGRIKKLMVDNKRRSIRTVAAKVKLNPSTISKLMKKEGFKAFHKRKVQHIKDDHKLDRVRFAKWALKKYGKSEICLSAFGWCTTFNFSFPSVCSTQVWVLKHCTDSSVIYQGQS